jgi:ATP/maltotriose-dependent transcriptional regulator MalT
MAELVGRDEDLGVLERLLEDLDAGQTSVLVVAGDPGIGKTRLLSELRRRAGERGDRVVVGRAMEFEREVPFALVVAAFDEASESLHDDQLRELGSEYLAELRRIFPSLRGTEAPSGLEVERYRLHRAVRALIEAMAGEDPLVVVLDDVHWADEATLELLAYLLRRRPRTPVLIAMAYRDRQVPERLLAALDAASREGLALEVRTLLPLSEAETRTLLAKTSLDSRSMRKVHKRSGGNPFYAEQLARSTSPTAKAHTPRDDDEVPAGLVAAVASEVDSLAAEAVLLLRGAAVAGDPFEVDLAAAGADMDPSVALELLDSLTAADLVRRRSTGVRFRFRHPIVRAAVYHGAGSGWRIDAHRRVAAALEARGASAVMRAHHVERSAVPGDEEARRVLVAAAKEATARAPAAAARWYQTALELTAERDREARLEMLVAASHVLAAAGNRELARTRLVEGLRLIPVGDVSRRVEVVALCAGLEHQLGRPDEAQARLQAALESLPPDASEARAALEIEIAALPAWIPWRSDGDQPGVRALAHAEVSGDAGLIARAYAGLAVGATFMGRYDVAAERADQAAALVDSAPDDVMSSRIGALLNLGTAEAYCDRYDAAGRHLKRGLKLSRAMGHGRFVPQLLTQLARMDAVAGRFALAREGVENALDAARLQDDTMMQLFALAFAVKVELLAGMPAAAEGPAREAYELARTLPGTLLSLTATGLYGLVCTSQGDHELAVKLLVEADGARSASPNRAAEWVGLVTSLAVLGRVDEARTTLQRIYGRTQHFDRPAMVQSSLDGATAQLMLCEGRGFEGVNAARRALEHADACGAVVDAARCRLLLGRALALAGERERAVAELERAHVELESFGADGHRDAAARELRVLGRRVARRGSRGSDDAVGALSARELEVAKLAAEGLTNRQIGERLYVSQKTVETHLSHVFEKLGVSRRIAVRPVLERLGVGPIGVAA